MAGLVWISDKNRMRSNFSFDVLFVVVHESSCQLTAVHNVPYPFCYSSVWACQGLALGVGVPADSRWGCQPGSPRDQQLYGRVMVVLY